MTTTASILKNAQKLSGKGLGAEAARALNGQTTNGGKLKSVKRDGVRVLTPESAAMWIAKNGNTLVRLGSDRDGMKIYQFSTPMGQGNVGYAKDIIAQSAAKSGVILIPVSQNRTFLVMDRYSPSESPTNEFSLSPKVQKRVKALASKLGGHVVLDQSTGPSTSAPLPAPASPDMMAPMPGAWPVTAPAPAPVTEPVMPPISPWGNSVVPDFPSSSPMQALGNFLAAGAEIIGDDPDYITVRNIKYMSSRVERRWRENTFNRLCKIVKTQNNPSLWFFQFVKAGDPGSVGYAGDVIAKLGGPVNGPYIVLGGKYPGFVVVPRCQIGESVQKIGVDQYLDLYGPKTRQMLEAMTGPKGGWAVVSDPSPWLDPQERIRWEDASRRAR